MAAGREIPWLVYARQPDNVYFSHAPHVKRAGIECRRCHGDHGLSATTPVYQFNRISTYSRNIWGPRIAGGGPNEWDSMKMSDCVELPRRARRPGPLPDVPQVVTQPRRPVR